MDNEFLQSVSNYIGINNAHRAVQRISGFEKRFINVMETGRLPENGFSEPEILAIINKLSTMDSNNWRNSSGVGEREGRILLNLIRHRHFGFAHGIGRSGDITAIQPKASGSSLINRLVNSLLLDWLRRSGTPSTEACLLVPMATGMTLTFCLLTLKRRRGPLARYVIWPRIDQKSCLKCITAAGLIPVPIEPIRTVGRERRKKTNEKEKETPTAEAEGETELTHADQLSSNLEGIKAAMLDPEATLRMRHRSSQSDEFDHTSHSGPESIVCVLSTTSCFSPRVPDRLPAITRLCRCWGIPHLVNNAYGVQSRRCMGLLESAWFEARRSEKVKEDSESEKAVKCENRGSGGDGDTPVPIDILYVQSTDKNLMVPVGGAIIGGFSKSLINEIAESYPGRASASPSVDVFATLLHLGRSGWERLLAQREACYHRLAEGLARLASKYGLRLMHTPENGISLALSLQALCGDADGVDATSDISGTTDAVEPRILTQLGAQLFTQGCSGVRVVVPAAMERLSGVPPKVVAGVRLEGFNSHSSTSTEVYMNAAAAVGQTTAEVDLFLSRLDKAISSFHRRKRDA